jgi:RNA polymerase sigma-70 factor (ECF subfamily)
MSMDESDIKRLLCEARAGSTEAMGRLLEAVRPYLLLVAGKEMDSGLQSKGGASDLVQESCLEVQRDLPDFHGATPAELMAWLRQVVRNNAKNFARAFRETEKRDAGRELSIDESGRGKALRGKLLSQDPAPDGKAAEEEQRRRLLAAIDGLPDHYRKVIQLRHMDRASFKEIGENLGATAEAARKIWFRAVDRLRKQMQETS